MKLTAILLGGAVLLTAGACTSSQMPEEDEGSIRRTRNTEFSGPHLRVFLTLDDGTDLSVNTTDDAIATMVDETFIPGHEARNWTFVQENEDGIAVVYALVSWDSADPADYLMAGWWAQFHDQGLDDLSFENTTQHAILDGPEIDPDFPPEVPASGQVTYAGQAGGLYRYVPGSDFGENEGAYVLDEWDGMMTLTADFTDGTVSGCIGCVGDLVTRRAHFGVFLWGDVPDVRSVAEGYELHLDAAPIGQDGKFEWDSVQVVHPDREVTHSEGSWGGGLSNLQDAAGNPRLAAGFVGAGFNEADGSTGTFGGAFVTLSEEWDE